MKLQSNQIKPGLKTSSEKYHRDIIQAGDIKAIRIRVFDNEPDIKPVYEPNRYKSDWQIWDKTSDPETDPATWRLTNKLSQFRTFKNVKYTDEHRAWYAKLVNDCQREVELNSQSLVLQSALGCKVNMQKNSPFKRMPYFANQFLFDGSDCYGTIFIHEHEFDFTGSAEDWEHEDHKKRSWQCEYTFM